MRAFCPCRPQVGAYEGSVFLATTHDAVFLSAPVAVFLGRALIVILFALRQCDFAFGSAAHPVKAERYAGVALFLHGPKNFP